MGFGDKVKKGFNDATRVGSDSLDKRRQDEKIGDYSREIEEIKKEMGNAIFVSYLRGDPVDERFVGQCERISALVGKMNDVDSKQRSGDYSVPDDGSGNAGFK
ncbi:MAG: hypothetical protein FWG60_03610 [Methanomassiliicoccaceae archaeon]|nr:hypothetical protein [Methanomassiliicoccaceae archaeon]